MTSHKAREEIEKAKGAIKKAHDELCRICKDPASFRMSIPAQETDSDLVIQAGLDAITEIMERFIRYEEALEKMVKLKGQWTTEQIIADEALNTATPPKKEV